MARVTAARAALGGGRGSSISTAQANGTREFSKQEVAFGVGLGGPFAVAGGVRLLDVVVDFGEASPVRVLGSRIQHLTGVAQRRSRQPGGVVAVDVCGAAGLGGDEVQRVELPARVGEEPRQVMHAFEIADVHGLPVEDHRPVVTLATKHGGARHWFLVARREVRCWRGFDSLEDRAGRLALQVGRLVPAAGVVGLGQAKAGERRLVRGTDFVPQPHRFGQGLFCARHIAVGELHSSSGVSGAGNQGFALETGGDAIELVCG